MTQRPVWMAGVLWLVLGALVGCGGSPTTPPPPAPVPTTAPVVSLDALVATPVSPAHGSAVSFAGQTVTLVASVPPPPAGALIVDTFEFDTSADLSSPTTRAIARTSGSSEIVVTLSSGLHVGKTLYWRVRASAGELRGPYSTVFAVRVPEETLRPPVLLEPAHGAILPSSPRLTLSKVIHSAERERTWSYEFEIARDEGFSSLVERSRVGEPNISVVGMRPADELDAGRYFWRARTFDNVGNISDYTPSRMFEVREAFVATPTPVSPAPGASVAQWATFELANGEVFGSSDDVPRLEVQLSASQDFSVVAAQGWAWASSSGTTAVTVQSNLPGGTYYWRTRGVKLKTATLPEMVSAWTAPRPVVLVGLVLAAPQVASPANRATTTLRPTLVVTNAARSGGSAGAVTYRFELSTDPQFVLPPVITVTVPEGPGTTSWTLPFDAPVGIPLYWRVRATDGPTGAMSPLSTSAQFAAVDRSTRLYTLSLGSPATCGFVNAVAPIFVQTTDGPGSLQRTLVSHDATPHTADSMVMILHIGADGSVSGTLGGTATGLNRTYSVAMTSGSQTPATVTGRATGDQLSGTFTGRVVEASPPVSSSSCVSTTFTWSLVPRQ